MVFGPSTHTLPPQYPGPFKKNSGAATGVYTQISGGAAESTTCMFHKYNLSYSIQAKIFRGILRGLHAEKVFFFTKGQKINQLSVVKEKCSPQCHHPIVGLW